MSVTPVADFAAVDNNTNPNPAAARSAGVRLIIPRGAYGRKVAGGADPTSPIYLDPCAKLMPTIRAANCKTSTYLFVCVPRKGRTTPEPEEQVNAFLDYVLPLIEMGVDLVPFIDMEEDSDVLPFDQLFTWYERAATRCHERLGAWPGVYSSQRYCYESLRNHNPGKLANCPWWVAKPWPWPLHSPVHLFDGPTQPTSVAMVDGQWVLFQKQGDGTGLPGFDKTVDISIVHTFGQGAKGATVKLLQRWLNASGISPTLLDVDGDFGPKTEIVLKAFQLDQGLQVDGIFGLQTMCAASWIDLG